MTTLTNDQITAGAAVLCDHGQPIGRNAAIAVFDAMQADTPAAFAKRYSELVCENALLKKQLAETKPKCPTCKGNDTTAPCAYPGSGMDGCLRDKRLAASPPQIVEKVELLPLSAGLPSPDDHNRILVYTDGVDFAGQQYFDIKADALWEPAPEDRNEIVEAATHWMPLPAAPSPNNSPVGAKEQDK